MYPTAKKKVDYYQVNLPPLPTVLGCLTSNGSPRYLPPVNSYLAHGAALDGTQTLCVLILWYQCRYPEASFWEFVLSFPQVGPEMSNSGPQAW